MKKPNYHYRRYDSFLAETQDMSVAAIGAFELLNAHAWHRWNPEQHPFPFLPNNDELLRTLCNRPRNWHRLRDEVLAKFTFGRRQLVLSTVPRRRTTSRWSSPTQGRQEERPYREEDRHQGRAGTS